MYIKKIYHRFADVSILLLSVYVKFTDFSKIPMFTKISVKRERKDLFSSVFTK